MTIGQFLHDRRTLPRGCAHRLRKHRVPSAGFIRGHAFAWFRPRSGAERRGRRVKTDCWSFCVSLTKLTVSHFVRAWRVVAWLCVAPGSVRGRRQTIT